MGNLRPEAKAQRGVGTEIFRTMHGDSMLCYGNSRQEQAGGSGRSCTYG